MKSPGSGPQPEEPGGSRRTAGPGTVPATGVPCESVTCVRTHLDHLGAGVGTTVSFVVSFDVDGPNGQPIIRCGERGRRRRWRPQLLRHGERDQPSGGALPQGRRRDPRDHGGPALLDGGPCRGPPPATQGMRSSLAGVAALLRPLVTSSTHVADRSPSDKGPIASGLGGPTRKGPECGTGKSLFIRHLFPGRCQERLSDTSRMTISPTAWQRRRRWIPLGLAPAFLSAR